MPAKNSKSQTRTFTGFASPTSNTTYTPNQFFDVCLPNHSRGVVRLVGYMIRRTLGWCDANGNPQHEEIWADFYSTFGQLSNGASLLYDATKGSIGAPSVTDDTFTPPGEAGNGFIWVVVHDNRGGASWVTIPVQAQ